MAWILVVDGGGQLPEMFAGVVEFEDFDGIRKGEVGVFPNAGGTIAKKDHPFGMVESTPPSFLMEQDGDLAASLAGADIACWSPDRAGMAILVAQGLALCIEVSLGERHIRVWPRSCGRFSHTKFIFILSNSRRPRTVGELKTTPQGQIRTESWYLKNKLWRDSGLPPSNAYLCLKLGLIRRAAIELS